MNLIRYALCLSAVTTAAWSAEKVSTTPATADDYLRAIRADDLKTLKSMSHAGVGDVHDGIDWTPLHYAALYGSLDAVRILLAAGGDPNARNKSQITPLIYAAYSFEKTRLLVEKGGDVNAKASDGSTPLWVATSVSHNGETIRYLLDKGADPKVVRSNGVDYLMRAATYQDASIVRLLLNKGLDPQRRSSSGLNALAQAVKCSSSDNLKTLIDAGSAVNIANTTAGAVKNGPIESTGVTPLMAAANCGNPDAVSLLLKAGAKVNTIDDRKMSALMMAVATDLANPEVLRLLLAAGADVNLTDRNRETALDWARKFRNPEILALLEKAGAQGQGLPAAPVKPADYHPDLRTAIAQASGLLAKSAESFFIEGGGCVGCHHQPFAGRAFAAVKKAGLPAEPRLRMTLINGEIPERARQVNRLPLMTAGGGGFDSFLYPLAGFADMGEPASTLTDMMVHNIAENQQPSGVWALGSGRPPLQESNITRTMLAISALKSYGWPARQAEFRERIALARGWLLTARANTTLDESDRLLGLYLAGSTEAELRPVAQRLLADQRADGGWAQTRNLDSDAFGTSSALESLRRSGMLQVSDPAYQKAVRYLLDTQFPDGSWYVRSRAVKLQPYFQSAFPYNHDQWISNSATAYAVMALAPAAKVAPAAQ
jgi:ankyrin repeat protein